MLQLQLIALYDYVCQCYDRHLCLHFQRHSNNHQPDFTDQELITIYLFGLLRKRFTMRQSYDYIVDHWLDWFPKLPSYQAVNYRLNQASWHFESLVDELVNRLQSRPCHDHISLVDSLPIIVSKRPYHAKVAPDWADKGFCSTKRLYYHGLKLHFMGFDRRHTMPLPERFHFSPASANDLTILKQTVLPFIEHRTIVGDKIYASEPVKSQVVPQHVEIMTPIKLQKGQQRLDAADALYSRYVSSIRQPVESFFNWLIDKTQIQTASKVRSQQGLLLHCLGRLAAGLYIMLFNP